MITNTRTFDFHLDDTAFKIIPIKGCVGEDPTFIWVSYGPTEGGLSIDSVDVMTKKIIISEIFKIANVYGINLIPSFNEFLLEIIK